MERTFTSPEVSEITGYPRTVTHQWWTILGYNAPGGPGTRIAWDVNDVAAVLIGRALIHQGDTHSAEPPKIDPAWLLPELRAMLELRPDGADWVYCHGGDKLLVLGDHGTCMGLHLLGERPAAIVAHIPTLLAPLDDYLEANP